MRILDVKGKVGAYNGPDSEKLLGGGMPLGQTVPSTQFFFRETFRQDKTDPIRHWDNLRLHIVSGSNLFETWEPASLELTFGESENDPWAALAPTKVLGGGWTKWNSYQHGTIGTKPVEATPELLAKLIPAMFDTEMYRPQDLWK